ncbi:hypothetical protein AGMMS49944_11570 [Spirochaetia bacterium]|nr:hypothetical protein AGMMS49944_11570 [Spirochaetia bacterium]
MAREQKDTNYKDELGEEDINGKTTLTLREGDTTDYRSQGIAVLKIPDGITAICASFMYNDLTELVFPNSVTVIGDQIFGSNELNRNEPPRPKGRGI